MFLLIHKYLILILFILMAVVSPLDKYKTTARNDRDIWYQLQITKHDFFSFFFLFFFLKFFVHVIFKMETTVI